MKLTHKDLESPYEVFKDTLSLNDGGVIGNLGIEVMFALRSSVWKQNTFTIICDAERPQMDNPSSFIPESPDLMLQGLALSHAARQRLKCRLPKDSYTSISLFDRAMINGGLDFEQKPDYWALNRSRCSLMGRGLRTTDSRCTHRHFIREIVSTGLGRSIKEKIQAIITEAGGPKHLTVPGEEDLLRCSIRPKMWVGFNAVMVLARYYWLYYGAFTGLFLGESGHDNR